MCEVSEESALAASFMIPLSQIFRQKIREFRSDRSLTLPFPMVQILMSIPNDSGEIYISALNFDGTIGGSFSDTATDNFHLVPTTSWQQRYGPSDPPHTVIFCQRISGRWSYVNSKKGLRLVWFWSVNFLLFSSRISLASALTWLLNCSRAPLSKASLS